MKRLMKVETNTDTMLVTYEPETKIARVLNDAEDIDALTVEDDSSWNMFEDVEDIEEWLGVDYNNSDAPKILVETYITHIQRKPDREYERKY